MAILGKKTWMKHGALDYYECVGAKLQAPWGTPFNKQYKLKSDETLIFAFIVYKSKKHRDLVNKKVHKEFDEMNMEMEMPFDVKRFTTGEFKVIVSS